MNELEKSFAAANNTRELMEITSELVVILDAYEGIKSFAGYQNTAMDQFTALAEFLKVAQRAKRLKNKPVKLS